MTRYDANGRPLPTAAQDEIDALEAYYRSLRGAK
jgi:hypothetical protein